ncbi:MAG: class I SAM-dependent methyltransferase, partial [Thermoflexales bacterium]|nr:class I SAM-dependent methyltransferase [Thermoflexales bacterium]
MRASHEIKQRQKKFINEKLQPLERIEYEGNYYHDFFRSLPFVALKQLLDRMSLSLNQKTVLVAGCGVGTDIHYLSKHYTGVEFIVCDLSEEAVKICIKNWPTARGYVEDIERLTFADESFDFVFV